MNRTPLPAKDRHSWVSGDISDAHQGVELNRTQSWVSFDRCLKSQRLTNCFKQQVPESGEVIVKIKTLFNNFSRLRTQSAAQCRIGQQSLNPFSQCLWIPGG